MASDGYPYVGEIIDYEMDCDPFAIAEQAETKALYPNPASHSFTVEGKIKGIMVFDALGQMVYQGADNTVEVVAWPQGVYFVRIVDENDAVSTVKFVKQ